MKQKRTYIAIDLKSFYASVECVERGLDPLDANLVVADATRSEQTICLAVSPPLKAEGVPGRPRLFEVIQKVREINARRAMLSKRRQQGKSYFAHELKADPSLALDYIVARPQMAKYLAVSTKVYEIYLRYIAPEDIHVYSVDEVFIDVTNYLFMYRMTAREIATMLIRAVLKETGITATAGIGPNLFLCKVAMDIDAKHSPPDEFGVRLSELDEQSFRERLWDHQPLTDFWRIGHGYAKKLEAHGMFTMGDVAQCSLTHEDLLYDMFGVNAELLIDHAWGYEPCTMEEIKKYRPASQSLSTGQVLPRSYTREEGRLIIAEMAELLALDLVAKGLVTDQIVLSVGYDTENLKDPDRLLRFSGPIVWDHYARPVPKPSHGSMNLERFLSSGAVLRKTALALYDRIALPGLSIRRVFLVANHVLRERDVPKKEIEQIDLFYDAAKADAREAAIVAALDKERRGQLAAIAMRKKYGKNAIIKGMNLKKGGTTIERNAQIGGHRA